MRRVDSACPEDGTSSQRLISTWSRVCFSNSLTKSEQVSSEAWPNGEHLSRARRGTAVSESGKALSPLRSPTAHPRDKGATNHFQTPHRNH
ncbi:hypothetical protein NPIL_334211 [Nephila pilipes]|uniref:Uncharacterized protein n=1 Tax=Nephila pilipes TaxID=299642 RepID=A0A8X6MWD4_NEPPI|nr:hypothetical protein NPIL_334211 [Nephila pilipes]